MNIQNEFQNGLLVFLGATVVIPGALKVAAFGYLELSGGGHELDSLKKTMMDQVDVPPPGYEEPSLNLAYIFNRQTMKLITAMKGGQIDDYEVMNS